MTTNDKVLVPREVLELYQFMVSAFAPFTPQQEQIAISLRKAKAAMLAAAPQPAEDGLPGLPEWCLDDDRAVYVLEGMSGKKFRDCMTEYGRKCIAYAQQRGAAVVVDEAMVERALGPMPAEITNSEAWPQGYADGFNDAVKMTTEFMRSSLTAALSREDGK